WQVAILDPGTLSVATVCWLLGLYLAAAGGAGSTVGIVAALLGRDALVARRWAATLVAGVGAAIVLSEVGLRQLQPLSAWRPLVTVAALVAAVPVAMIARRWRRVPAAMAVLGLASYAAGGMLAAGALVREPSGSAPGAGQPGQRRGPNILVVLVDTLRADHLGCYGYTRPTSAAIDAFAREGVQFRHAYSQSTWT